MKKLLIFSILAIALTNCKKHEDVNVVKPTPKTYTNIIILGNSITYTPPSPSIGWTGNWGMAATSEAKDYAHLLQARFIAANSSAKVTIQNIAEFEFDYQDYDIDANLHTFRDAKPDLLILRIGENIDPTFPNTDSVAFARAYKNLIAYFQTSNPNLKIVAVGPCWEDRDLANHVMQANSPNFVSLQSMDLDINGNFSYNLWPGNSVLGPHPCDQGMLVMSNLIWAAVSDLK